MFTYFELRRKREEREFKGVTAERSAHLRAEREYFSGKRFEQLYKIWLAGGPRLLGSTL